MQQHPFSPHGSALVELEPGILISHMHGDWNAEMQAQIAREMRALAPQLNAAGPWGIINHMHDTVVYGPDVYTKTRADYAGRPTSSLLTAVAFVIAPHVEGASLFRSRFETLLDGVIASKVFADGASAKEWILAQLQQATAPDTDARN